MDIPTLGIDGACLSIIGQLGESRGVLIFPSLDGFERFLAAANASRREHGAITMGTELLSLTFQHATELPPSMYREAMRNALPVESQDAYPLVAHRNPNGIGCGSSSLAAQSVSPAAARQEAIGSVKAW